MDWKKGGGKKKREGKKIDGDGETQEEYNKLKGTFRSSPPFTNKHPL